MRKQWAGLCGHCKGRTCRRREGEKKSLRKVHESALEAYGCERCALNVQHHEGVLFFWSRVMMRYDYMDSQNYSFIPTPSAPEEYALHAANSLESSALARDELA